MVQPPRRSMANDGYAKPLQEGYVEKGGVNPARSQVQVRPAAPAPMRPAAQNPPNGPASPDRR